MRNIVILGAGGSGAEVTFYIEDHNSKVGVDQQIRISGYIDDSKENWEKYNYKAPLLSTVDSYTPKEDEEVLIAIMDINLREKLIKTLLDKNAKIGSFIHESVIKPDISVTKVPKLPSYIGGIIVPNAAQKPSAIA